VQSNAIEGSGVGSVSVSFPTSNTAGNLIIAFVRMSSRGQTSTGAYAATFSVSPSTNWSAVLATFKP